MAGGRPTKYDPSFCEQVIAIGEDGGSLAEMAVAIDVSRDTFHRWRDLHPEFSDAVKVAIHKSQAWWEREGRLATFGGHDGFNATAWIFNMKNRFKEDWRDKQDIEHVGSVGVTMSDADLEKIAAGVLK